MAKIFIDFDGVILNTKKLNTDLDKIYFRNSVSKLKLKECKKTISGAPKKVGVTYQPERIVAFLKKGDKKGQKKILSEIGILLEDLKKYVFADALFFLKNIAKKNLLLLSYGDTKYQKNKIFGSGTNKYFSKIIIDTRNKLYLIMKTAERHKLAKDEKIFFIDDKLENLEKIEKMDRKITTIWLDRYNMKDCNLHLAEIDHKITNLKEALEIIRNKN